MLQVTAQSKIFLAIRPVDFRKGIEGLMAVCQQQLGQNPFLGSLFVFRNRKGTSLKILVFDGQGFWLCQKTLAEGKLRWWPKSRETTKNLNVSQLQILLWNGNPMTAQIAPDWKRIE